MKTRLLLLVAWLALAMACESESDNASPSDPNAQTPAAPQAGSGATPMMEGPAGAPAAEPPPDPTPEQPLGPDADVFAWSTEKFTLEAGEERYLCFAKTLDEGLVVNGYSSAVDPFVHHLIFSRARAPETEGFAECDVAFRNNWETLFISGAGDTTLEFPADAGHQLTQGTQLVVQMHLLNVAESPVEGAVTIHMRRSSIANPRPVSSYIFGTAAVELPPQQTSEVVGTCAPRQQVQLIAAFPHMHLLGTSLSFEVGTPDGAMQEVFKRDPFDFNEQRIEKLDVTVAAGNPTRVRCTFNNTLDETVGYGESTRNEMCYLVGFAVDLPSLSACIEVLPPGIFGP